MSIDLSAYKTEKKPHTDFSFKGRVQFGKKFTDKRKEVLYRELGTLLQSGVDFKKSLEILSQLTKRKVDREIILKIKKDVVEGKSIYEAMMTSGYFSPYEYYSVQIGEETRKLEEILLELQNFFHRKVQMRRQIISVLTYPSIVLGVTFLVLYFMLTKVVPMFSSVFKQFGSELPASTQYIIRLSNNSGMLFTLTGIFVLSIALTHYLLRGNQNYRGLTSKLVLRIPYFGNLVRKIYLARFCQAMNLLTASKTPILNSLSLTAKMIGFYPIEKSIEGIKDDVIKGMNLHDSLRKYRVYEDKMVSMVEVAEQVNQLDVMFGRLSEQYNEDINYQTKMIGVVLEPAIIIIIGIVVGVIMISMYAPMFDLSKIITH